MIWPKAGGNEWLRCPECGSSRPALTLFELKSRYWNGKRYESVVTGERVACQDCPCVYSVGPDGIFRQHPRSLPYTTPQAVPAPASREDTLNEEPRPVFPPVPRRAPNP